MKSVVIIPARYASTRFPGKPLVNLLGKPMILWVAELSSLAVGTENVYVATEDMRIKDVVEMAGYQAVMTSNDALTGTDRVAEAANKIEADIYINVQGDEPILDPADIIKIRDAKIQDMNRVINGYTWLSELENPDNVNIPKVITNEQGRLVYMSRVPLPGYKEKKNAPILYKKQVCIYAFTIKELNAFYSFGRKSKLESSEDIEILRFLELGINILMVETTQGSLAIDMPEDVYYLEKEIKKNKNG
jgi:3-deoxy-manno-octulosonate cytidylyltransferase (CMP-KDO synthetase)